MSDAAHIVCPHCDSVNRVPSQREPTQAKCGQCHRPLFEGKPQAVDGAQLQRHIQRNDVPVLVDFWAQWCGPCKMMAPAFEQAAQRLEPQLRLLKLDTDRHAEAATQFGIRGIPTLILFRGGREQARQSGAMNANSLLAWVQQHL